MGAVYTDGIAGTALCDSSRPLPIAPSTTSLPVVPSSPNNLALVSPCNSTAVQSPMADSSPNPTPSKRPKMTRRELQNLEMLDAEKSLVATVQEMKVELRRTNEVLGEFLVEMKRSNNIQEQLVG